MKKRLIIGVIGGSVCKTRQIGEIAYDVGREIARRGHLLVCGGMGGVMEFACRGATENGGMTIGILPGKNRQESNPYIDIPIVTAMSHARNAIIVRTADALIAVDGEYGTLSEIALAKVLGKPVYGLSTWNIRGVIKCRSPKKILDSIEKIK